MKRIIPVSSGKGGVGKTTFAINFALGLSKYGKTVLIDLDFGTSSIRNSIDIPIKYDLYHFFKKDVPLKDCITPLDSRLDPKGEYKNFGFIASPYGSMDEFVHLDEEKRRNLIREINSLDANFIILDLKAGLDSRVLDFMPFSNSGILIFTPTLPSANFAAVEIVRAQILRRLRVLFSPSSPLWRSLKKWDIDYVKLFSEILQKIEDVYDETFKNIDKLIEEAEEALREEIVERLKESVWEFKVYFVLNRFNELDESVNYVISPFLSRLSEFVSSGLSVTSLGWIVESKEINESGCKKIPALLLPSTRKREVPTNILDLISGAEKQKVLKREETTPPSDLIQEQIDMIKRAYTISSSHSFRENFEYIVKRALFLLKNRPIHSFGAPYIVSSEIEMEQILFGSQK
jgi:MinD-like ATPase involved in chromosome partitioning or flagellar assembly